MAIEVRQVRFPEDARAFVDTWWRVFEGDPCWVPPLLSEQLRFLNPAKNPYFKVATIQPFMAFKDGVAVGTFAATVDHYTQKHDPGVGFFGFFEFVEDPEVAAALLEAATAWFRERGIHTLRGPFNFNINHEFGLRVDPFDDLPCIGNPHNQWYYPQIYEKTLGMTKARDWYAYWMGYGPIPKTMRAISERFEERNPEFSIRPLDPSKFWEQCEMFWELYNDAWEHNWGHVYMERDEFMEKARGLKAVLDPSLAFFGYMGDEVAAAAITLPDYNQVAVHMNGRVFPFGWWHFLNKDRYVSRLRVLVLGVKKKFQNLPLGAPMYVRTWDEAKRRGTIRGVEASLIVEDNHRMRGALEKLGGRIRTTYRSYEKVIGEVPGAPAAETPAEGAPQG